MYRIVEHYRREDSGPDVAAGKFRYLFCDWVDAQPLQQLEQLSPAFTIGGLLEVALRDPFFYDRSDWNC